MIQIIRILFRWPNNEHIQGGGDENNSFKCWWNDMRKLRKAC